MLASVRNWLKRIAAACALVLLTIFAVRAIEAWRSAPLQLWHTEVPTELHADELAAASWDEWLEAESRVMAEVRARVTDKLPAAERVAANRYHAGSPLNSARHGHDWNRTQVLMPEGEARGAVVLLHGLTDSPYSLRHVASHYRTRGFIAITVRMPGHGTVPAALTRVRWKDWQAASRLAIRHARSLGPDDAPLHVVGYSNGGALALKYALDALEDDSLVRPDRVVLISPMIGITSLARFAGMLGWPAAFPPFAKAAWLTTAPEYNPFKYNSFPVNAARQSSQLVSAVQEKLLARTADGTVAKLPPITAFQSVYDATVFPSAVVETLFATLPANGSELILFDRNHAAHASALMNAERRDDATALLPPAPRQYRVTVVTNAGSEGRMAARSTPAGEPMEASTSLALDFPPNMFSLSHVALPFPPDDSLYGYLPSSEDFGVRLGTTAVRGERGLLVVDTDDLMRASCNPFFEYLLERIDASLAEGRGEERHEAEPTERD